MTSKFLRHVIEGKLLGIHSEVGCFSSEFPTLQASVYRGLWDLLACWQRTGSKRKNVYFLVQLSEIESVDQPYQYRVIRPKSAVNEYVESARMGFRVINHRGRAKDRRCGRCEAHIDEGIIVVSVVGIIQVGRFKYP